MRLVRYSFFVLLTVVTAGNSSLFADDLDAALAAQKKQAQRRVYSETARLDDQKLVIPREATEEEKASDKKLKAIDAKLDARPAPFSQPMPARPATATVRPAENQNWLTAAILDNDASMVQTNDTQDAWMLREMERQKDLKAQEAFVKENEQVEKLLREKTQQQQQSSSPELELLKKYQLAPQKLFGGKDKESAVPSYMTPRSGTPDPLAAIRPAARNEKPVAPPLFSPEAARISSALDKDPLRSTRSPALHPDIGSPVRQSRPGFSPSWGEPKAESLTPIEMIRKSSPINRANPFADDHMPQIKTSIWE